MAKHHYLINLNKLPKKTFVNFCPRLKVFQFVFLTYEQFQFLCQLHKKICCSYGLMHIEPLSLGKSRAEIKFSQTAFSEAGLSWVFQFSKFRHVLHSNSLVLYILNHLQKLRWIWDESGIMLFLVYLIKLSSGKDGRKWKFFEENHFDIDIENMIHIMSEMEKRADTAEISVFFFGLC